MADPASIGMDDLAVAFEQVGVIIDHDVVSIQILDQVLRIERVARNAAGLPSRNESGGVGTVWSEIPLVAITP